MSKLLRAESALIGGALALAAASASAAQITLFEQPAFQGSYAATTFAIPDLQSSGYRETASSVIVNDGMWEVCTGSNYAGRCAQLVPGSYAMLSRDLNGRVASVRQVGYSPGPSQIVIRPDAQAAVAAGTLNAPVVSGAAGNGGTVVAPPSASTVAVSPPAGQVILGTIPAGAALPMGRVVLYQNPNFGGPSAIVEHGRMPDLDWAHFGYPVATSLRIESGTWVACSDMGYQGQCRVLGPGDYPSLTGVFDQGISSMRQIG